MTETARAPEKIWPPDGITGEAFDLDDVTFVPHPHATTRIEQAYRGGDRVGEVLFDDNRFWFARKPDQNGEWCDWKEMRCVHEARAFIVSKVRQ